MAWWTVSGMIGQISGTAMLSLAGAQAVGKAAMATLVYRMVALLAVLAACGVAPVPGLPGRPLQPLLANEPVEWRTHLFTEYHTHAAAANYHPLRAVRSDRSRPFRLLPGDA